MPPLATNCFLCEQSLKYNATHKLAIKAGLPLTAFTHDPAAKSKAHYGHVSGKRARKQFTELSKEAWQKMGVQNNKGFKYLCYECHEVILHNPVLSESQLDELRELFLGQTFEERLIRFNRVIALGLETYRQQSKQS